MRYLDIFLSLRCASDVLAACGPFPSPSKEITEAITITQRIRSIVLKKPMEYNVVDLCAGNALSSVLSVMYLPVEYAVAVDKKARKRNWELVRRFKYEILDIFDKNVFDLINKQTIITSIHPCKRAALRVVEIYNNSDAPHLIMLPCCVQKDAIARERLPTLIRNTLSTHEQWAYVLRSKIEHSETNIIDDPKCLSARSLVITANRNKERVL